LKTSQYVISFSRSIWGRGRQRLRAEGMCGIKSALGGRCQAMKGQLTAFGHIRLEFPSPKCHWSLPPTSKSKQWMSEDQAKKGLSAVDL